jgi:hypothetical protein
MVEIKKAELDIQTTFNMDGFEDLMDDGVIIENVCDTDDETSE